MTIQRQPHRHPIDPTISCGSFRKPHPRSDNDDGAPRCSTSSGIKIIINRRHRTIISLATMVVATMAMVSSGSVSVIAAAAAVPREVKDVSLTLTSVGFVSGTHQFRMQATESAAGEEDGHDDHDHGEVADVAEESEDDHDGHDHGEVVATVEENHGDQDGHSLNETAAVVEEGNGDHDGHDHGEVAATAEESHSSHDGLDDVDDHHDGHDHGNEEFDSVSSTNQNAKGSLPWGAVIGATLLVNLAALSGVFIVVMTAVHHGLLKTKGEDFSDVDVGHGKVFDICIPAFAMGALRATAVFLIFPEALHLIEGAHADDTEVGDSHEGHDHRYLQEDSHEGHDDSSESVNAAKFGCAILGGFLLPALFSIIFHRTERDETISVLVGRAGDVEAGVSVTGEASDSHVAKSPSTIIQKIEENSPCEEEEPVVAEQESVPLVTKDFVNRQLCASVLLGDAFHNFGDGIFIGAAFKTCSTGTAVSIVLATLFHEIAQELADFVLLTRYAGLSIIKACVLNFISGLSVILGGVIFLAADPSDQATGIILAMAGGVYFNVAACETMPRLENVVKSRGDRVWILFSVIIGTVPIGLILLDHQHC